MTVRDEDMRHLWLRVGNDAADVVSTDAVPADDEAWRISDHRHVEAWAVDTADTIHVLLPVQRHQHASQSWEARRHASQLYMLRPGPSTQLIRYTYCFLYNATNTHHSPGRHGDTLHNSTCWGPGRRHSWYDTRTASCTTPPTRISPGRHGDTLHNSTCWGPGRRHSWYDTRTASCTTPPTRITVLGDMATRFTTLHVEAWAVDTADTIHVLLPVQRHQHASQSRETRRHASQLYMLRPGPSTQLIRYTYCFLYNATNTHHSPGRHGDTLHNSTCWGPGRRHSWYDTRTASCTTPPTRITVLGDTATRFTTLHVEAWAVDTADTIHVLLPVQRHQHASQSWETRRHASQLYMLRPGPSTQLIRYTYCFLYNATNTHHSPGRHGDTLHNSTCWGPGRRHSWYDTRTASCTTPPTRITVQGDTATRFTTLHVEARAVDTADTIHVLLPVQRHQHASQSWETRRHASQLYMLRPGPSTQLIRYTYCFLYNATNTHHSPGRHGDTLHNSTCWGLGRRHSWYDTRTASCTTPPTRITVLGDTATRFTTLHVEAWAVDTADTIHVLLPVHHQHASQSWETRRHASQLYMLRPGPSTQLIRYTYCFLYNATNTHHSPGRHGDTLHNSTCWGLGRRHSWYDTRTASCTTPPTRISPGRHGDTLHNSTCWGPGRRHSWYDTRTASCTTPPTRITVLGDMATRFTTLHVEAWAVDTADTIHVLLPVQRHQHASQSRETRRHASQLYMLRPGPSTQLIRYTYCFLYNATNTHHSPGRHGDTLHNSTCWGPGRRHSWYDTRTASCTTPPTRITVLGDTATRFTTLHVEAWAVDTADTIHVLLPVQRHQHASQSWETRRHASQLYMLRPGPSTQLIRYTYCFLYNATNTHHSPGRHGDTLHNSTCWGPGRRHSWYDTRTASCTTPPTRITVQGDTATRFTTLHVEARAVDTADTIHVLLPVQRHQHASQSWETRRHASQLYMLRPGPSTQLIRYTYCFLYNATNTHHSPGRHGDTLHNSTCWGLGRRHSWYDTRTASCTTPPTRITVLGDTGKQGFLPV